jgi:hypothetical protein
MSLLDKDQIEHLKTVFRQKWPDAIGTTGLKTGPYGEVAACLWLGFKEGYRLALEEERKR